MPFLTAWLGGLPVAVAIEQHAGELRRNHIPQLLIDYRRVFAGIGPFLVKRAVIRELGRALSRPSRWLLGLAPIRAAMFIQKRAQCEILGTRPSSV